MQVWDPDQCGKHARFVSDLGAPVSMVAIASSAQQGRAARDRGLDARVADVTALDFDGEFDAVFSNAVLHWIRDPDAALATIHRALAPGGRLVAELGGHGGTLWLYRTLHDTSTGPRASYESGLGLWCPRTSWRDSAGRRG